MITALLALAKSGTATVGKISLWDIAGAFTMIGCAAAIFGEPDQVALLFGQPAGQHSDAAAGDSYLELYWLPCFGGNPYGRPADKYALARSGTWDHDP